MLGAKSDHCPVCREPECAHGMGRSPHPSLDRERCGFRLGHPPTRWLAAPAAGFHNTSAVKNEGVQPLNATRSMTGGGITAPAKRITRISLGNLDRLNLIGVPRQAALRLSGHAISWSCRRPSWSQQPGKPAACNFTSRVLGVQHRAGSG